ncbi:MAG TPA: hypothetical protein VK645_04795 [Chitinophagaceae bacterium]|nr:hypothetical protein [Chitinophagaceae bacterium]
MSVQQSNITDLNYDLVVGVSQTGMNGIMKNYYQNARANFQQQTSYFMKNQYGEKFMPTDESTALAALGIDPFTITSWNGQGTMPATVQQCVNAGFNAAFRFTPGDPGDPNANPPTFPVGDYTYLTYVPNAPVYGSEAVFSYTLCCSDIQVVYWDATDNVWVNYTQPSTPGSPISSIVKFAGYAVAGTKTVAYNPSDNTLPPDVKAQAEALQAKNISFAIQQVPFQWDTMEPSEHASLPFMPKLNQFYFEWLGTSFIYAYAQALENSSQNQPVFCYALQQTNQSDQTVLNPTNLQVTMEQLVDANGNVISNPTPAQAVLDSFNYICSINGSKPVPAQQFNWNWFDTLADINGNSSYNGALAMSKFTLGKAFFNQLKDYVQNNCWVPQITCAGINGKDAWSFSMTGAGPLHSDPVMENNSDNYFLFFTYAPQPVTVHGVVNTSDYVTISPQFQLSVSIKDTKTITVFQWAKFTYTISLNGEEAMTGVPLDNSYTEDYTVSVTGTGTLVFQAGTPDIEKQGNQELVPYLTDAESAQLQKSIVGTESSMQSAGLSAEPLGSTQQVIFPGGSVFSFYDVQFTPKNDLACKINYEKTTS